MSTISPSSWADLGQGSGLDGPVSGLGGHLRLEHHSHVSVSFSHFVGSRSRPVALLTDRSVQL